MIELREAAVVRLPLRARLPFRYGIATMTEMPHLILRLVFAFEGKTSPGLAADNLAPKWFTKDPARSIDSEIEEMLVVIRAAVTHAREIRASSVFSFWHELYRRQAAWAAQNKIPPLLAHFGTSLVERALIDAFCRGQAVPFARALHENRFGLELGTLRGELTGMQPRNWLPATPAASILVRHTVGLSDPIDADDLDPAGRVDDGLPQTLAECVRFYGLSRFKIKIDGNAARDRIRIEKIAAVVAGECRGRDFAFSLDGNESFREVASFVDYARTLLATGPREFWARLLFIEQPLHRDVALSTAAGEIAVRWPERPPIIIDESDAELSSLPAALALGYAGTSHKNCKGVFKGIANACLLAQRRAAGLPGLLSGEDLTNVGPVALLQDLAVQSTLGVAHVERNGHHYFAGLAQFPPSMQQHVLRHHGDLFVAHSKTPNWPRVHIHEGKLAIGSVLAAAFGYADGLVGPDLNWQRWLA